MVALTMRLYGALLDDCACQTLEYLYSKEIVSKQLE
jgi:hypothetical protein